MTEKAKDILKENVKKDDTVIIGVSGGADSVFLLEICHEMSKKHGFKIVVAHVNHKLRGKESDDDEIFVKKICEKKGLIFEQADLKRPAKGNLEEIARKFRYTFFTGLLKKHKAGWIITAHHLDDNIETVLFNLIRGSFLNGLTGMDPVCSERNLLRPLLDMTKEEIIREMKKKKLRFRTDKSNYDLKYSRNLLRHKIIPLITKINPGFRKTFPENIILFGELKTYMDSVCENMIPANPLTFRKDLDSFLAQPPVIKKSELNSLYRAIHGNSEGFNQKHLFQIMEMMNKRQTGLKKEFGPGYFIKISRSLNGDKRTITVVKK